MDQLRKGQCRPLPPARRIDAVAKGIAGGYVITDEARDRLAKVGLPAEAVESFSALDMRLENGRLLFDPIGQPSIRVHASAPAKLFIKSPQVDIEVNLGEDAGPAQGITVSQGGLAFEYKRDDRGAKKARKALTRCKKKKGKKK